MFILNRLDPAAREIRRLNDEVNALQAGNLSLARELDALRKAAEEAKANPPRPANLGHITHFLRAYVPSLPMAPGYHLLTSAKNEQEFAQALNLLLLHARSVGHAEAKGIAR